MRLLLAGVAVFFISFIALSWDIRGTPIGSAYADPIAKVRAQDESMYVNSAIRMTEDGDWLTPKLMGRLYLFKPPLLQWLSAFCIQLGGLGLASVRGPSLLFGAAGVAIVFLWTAMQRSWPVAAAVALLLLSDPIWVTFSRLAFTDVLASTLALLAMYSLALDPELTRWRSRILFGVFAGVAVLAKSVVGVLPFAALALYCAVMPRDRRPAAGRFLQSIAALVAVAAPWHLYQLWTHPQWFWTEFVRFQLLAVGLTESTGVTGYSLFYIRRLLAMDPLLFVFVAVAAYGGVRAFRRRTPVEIAAFCWCGVVVLALAAFRGRSVSYMVLLIPAMCVFAGLFLPRTVERHWVSLLVLIGACMGVKAAFQEPSWSLRYNSPPADSVAGLREYYLVNRAAGLVIAAPDDAFYAITLPGLRVRYCYVDPSGAVASSLPHYAELGIAVTPAQLANLPALTPLFLDRLAKWRVRSEEPIGSAILLRSPQDMPAVIRALAGEDFNVPAAWDPIVAATFKETHVLQRSGARTFALSRRTAATGRARTLPAGW